MLDDKDLAILSALQDDARATYADVGAAVGLSASAVHERVRKLEQQGVIRGYRAVLDPEAIGLFVTALIAVTPLDPQPDDLPTGAGVRRGRGLLFGGRRGELRAQGEDRDDRRPRGPDPEAPGEGRRHHEHHDRPLDPVRGPATGHVSLKPFAFRGRPFIMDR